MRTTSKERGAARHALLRGVTLLALLVGAASCSTLEGTVTWQGEQGQSGQRVDAFFEGNSSISRFRLFRRIEDLLYDFSRDPDRESAIYDAALAIEDFYRSEGFPRIEVKYGIEAIEGGKRAVFTIHEGGLVVIEELELRGNHSLHNDELLRYLPERSSGALGFGRPIFVRRVLEGFASDIKTRYAQQGYLDATVQGPQVEFIEDGKAVRVHFDIREGPLFTLQRVEVAPHLLEAADGWTPDEHEGEPFGNDIASGIHQSLRRRLRSLGFPQPAIQALVEPVQDEDAGSQVVLRLQGETGPRAVIGAIAIEGNEKTQDYVILSRIELERNQLFDGENEDDSLRRLYETGLFKKVSVRYEPMLNGLYRAVFVVEEIPSQEIQLLAGYGSYELGRLGAKFEESNLFGTGLDLIWQGKISFKDMRTGITIVDPEIFVEDLRLSVSAEYFEREEPSYDDRGYRYDFAFDRPILDDLHGRIGYEFSSREGSTVDVPEIDPALEDYAKGEVYAEFLFDQRDNPIVPREGRQLTARFAYASEGLGGDIEFWRVSGKFVQYFPLSESTRFVVRYDTTALFPLEGSARIPLQERVFNGGSTTVRSYAYKELGPRSVNGQPIGGEYRQVISGELRFPLPFPLPILGPTEAALFVDAGNVGTAVQDWGFEDMKYALGAGLRYSLPFILRFDAGYNPDRDPGDSVWAFHLTIGTPF